MIMMITATIIVTENVSLVFRLRVIPTLCTTFHFNLPHIFGSFLRRRHRMVPAATMLVSAHQDFQASQEALDPRDQQVLREHQAIMDLKGPWALEETRVTRALVDDKVLEDPMELKGKQVLEEAKVLLVQQVALATEVMQVLMEVEVLKDQEELQGLWVVIGNSVFLRTLMMAGTLAW